MDRSDWGIDIFSLIGMSVAAFSAYKSGKKDGYKEYQHDVRDRELAELRRQVNELKANKDRSE